MHVIVDDIRELGADIIIRSGEAAQTIFPNIHQDITHLYMDHDLGDDRMDGYEFISWCISKNYLPQFVQLVTSNPVGRENMKRALIDAGYTVSRNGITLKREQ